MPNYCDNLLVIAGERQEVERFIAAVTPLNGLDPDGRQTALSLAAMVPPPPVSDAEAGEGWAIENWGSKCELDRVGEPVAVCAGDLTFASYRFLSAWAAPTIGFQRASERFDLTFHLAWSEPSWGDSGYLRYRHGREVAFLGGLSETCLPVLALTTDAPTIGVARPYATVEDAALQAVTITAPRLEGLVLEQAVADVLNRLPVDDSGPVGPCDWAIVTRATHPADGPEFADITVVSVGAGEN
jgi:hypothetical protein